MSIEVQCSACGKRLKAPDEQAGRSGKCPSCKAEISIPARAARGVAPAKSATEDVAMARGPPTTDDAAATIEAKHWFALGGGLRTTEMALVLECVSCGLIGMGMMADRLKASSTLADVLTDRTIRLLYDWGEAGCVLGWGAFVAGCFVSLAAWPSAERRWLSKATWGAVISIVVMLLLVTVQTFGILAPSSSGDEAAPLVSLPTATTLVASVACATTLILFNFFLAAVQLRMGRENVGRQPVIYAGVVGALTLWCLIANLAIAPSTTTKAWLIVLSNIAMFVAGFLWLWLANRSTTRELLVNQAWKRL